MDQKTHDYSRTSWGHNVSIMAVFDGGQRLRVVGWGNGIYHGDYIILANGAETTRYQVSGIEYQSNPRDMWLADLSFAPRQHGPSNGK